MSLVPKLPKTTVRSHLLLDSFSPNLAANLGDGERK
jgi:hypothetical protein